MCRLIAEIEPNPRHHGCVQGAVAAKPYFYWILSLCTSMTDNNVILST